MIKKQIPGFQSDIYLFLETIGGEMTISKSTYYVSFTKIHATVRNTILFPFFSTSGVKKLKCTDILIFLYFFTVSSDGLKRVISMQGFLSEDMSGKIILDIIIPPLSEQANVRTYKVKAKFMIKTL